MSGGRPNIALSTDQMAIPKTMNVYPTTEIMQMYWRAVSFIAEPPLRLAVWFRSSPPHPATYPGTRDHFGGPQ